MIHDILSSIQQWSEIGQANWVSTLMLEQSSDIQVFEFRYRLPQKFRWSAVADLGTTLVNGIIKMLPRYHVRALHLEESL